MNNNYLHQYNYTYMRVWIIFLIIGTLFTFTACQSDKSADTNNANTDKQSALADLSNKPMDQNFSPSLLASEYYYALPDEVFSCMGGSPDREARTKYLLTKKTEHSTMKALVKGQNVLEMAKFRHQAHDIIAYAANCQGCPCNGIQLGAVDANGKWREVAVQLPQQEIAELIAQRAKLTNQPIENIKPYYTLSSDTETIKAVFNETASDGSVRGVQLFTLKWNIDHFEIQKPE